VPDLKVCVPAARTFIVTALLNLSKSGPQDKYGSNKKSAAIVFGYIFDISGTRVSLLLDERRPTVHDVKSRQDKVDHTGRWPGSFLGPILKSSPICEIVRVLL
jgi:hypothetical protein